MSLKLSWMHLFKVGVIVFFSVIYACADSHQEQLNEPTLNTSLDNVQRIEGVSDVKEKEVEVAERIEERDEAMSPAAFMIKFTQDVNYRNRILQQLDISVDFPKIHLQEFMVWIGEDYFEYDYSSDESRIKLIHIDRFNKYSTSYFFNLMNYELTHVEQESKSGLSEFDVFYKYFELDSSFQFKHIQFPLVYSFLNDDYEIEDTLLNKEDWSYWVSEYGYETQHWFMLNTPKVGDTIKLGFRGIENGIFANYHFLKLNQSWNLVKVEEFSM